MNLTIHDEKGSVLVVTLAVAAVLVAAGFHIKRITMDSATGAAVNRCLFCADQLARSGINLAMMILADDAEHSTIDSVQEAWADPEILTSAVRAMGIGRNDRLVISITDELSRIQVNALLKYFPGHTVNPDQILLWQHFLSMHRPGRTEGISENTDEIINSLKDWLDSEDGNMVTGLSGAESDYYTSLEHPYECADGPLDDIRQLMHVKGLAKNLGVLMPAAGNEPDRFFTVLGLDPAKPENGGAFRYPGKININTADENIIAALLPQGMEGMAHEIAEFRLEKISPDGRFAHNLIPGWYKKIIPMSRENQAVFDSLVCYSSSIFRVKVSAVADRSRCTLTAFIKRHKKPSGQWTCSVIQVKRQE